MQNEDMCSLKSPLFEEFARDDFQKLEGYKVLTELDRQLLAGLVDPPPKDRPKFKVIKL